ERKVRGECVYCGQVLWLTKDHVPPRCIFPPPLPELVTVPCCMHCNRSASKDDEYFRMMVALRENESCKGINLRLATLVFAQGDHRAKVLVVLGRRTVAMHSTWDSYQFRQGRRKDASR